MFITPLGCDFEDAIDTEEVFAATRVVRIGVEDVSGLIFIEDAVAGDVFDARVPV